MSMTVDQDTARCTRVESSDRRFVAECPLRDHVCTVYDRALHQRVAQYAPEPGFDAFDALQRYQRQMTEARRERNAK